MKEYDYFIKRMYEVQILLKEYMEKYEKNKNITHHLIGEYEDILECENQLLSLRRDIKDFCSICKYMLVCESVKPNPKWLEWKCYIKSFTKLQNI